MITKEDVRRSMGHLQGFILALKAAGGFRFREKLQQHTLLDNKGVDHVMLIAEASLMNMAVKSVAMEEVIQYYGKEGEVDLRVQEVLRILKEVKQDAKNRKIHFPGLGIGGEEEQEGNGDNGVCS